MNKVWAFNRLPYSLDMCYIFPYCTKNEQRLYFLTRSSHIWHNCHRLLFKLQLECDMGWYGYKSHSENTCAEGEKLCAKHPLKKQPGIETLLNDIYYRSVDKLCIKVTIKVHKACRPSLFSHCQFGIFLWFLWYYLSCFLIWLKLNVFHWKPWSWWCPIYVWSQDGVVRTFLCLFDLKHVYHCLKNTKQRQIRSCSPTTTRFLNLKLNSSLTFLGLAQIST